MKFEEIKNKSAVELMKIIEISPFDFEIMDTMIYGQIVNNCITINEKGVLEVNLITVEILKRVSILNNLTNIKFEENSSEFNTELANWSNKIWDKLTKKIKNYELFEKLLFKALDQEIEKKTKLEYKISEVIDELINLLKNTNIEKVVKKLPPDLIANFTKLIKNKDKNERV